MTRKDAIEYGIKWLRDEDYLDAKDREFIKIALEVLKQEPHSGCISRQAVLDIINNPLNIRLDEIIKKLPPVNPQKTGHWIFDEILDRHYYCSECKSMGVDYWDYCPNCGARMVEPQEVRVRNDKSRKIYTNIRQRCVATDDRI